MILSGLLYGERLGGEDFRFLVFDFSGLECGCKAVNGFASNCARLVYHSCRLV